MPTYEYKCDGCGHEFEAFQSIKDDKLTKCPSCGKNKLKRLIGTGGGLIFKGSGFYLTDYKNKQQETSSSKTTVKATEKSKETSAKTEPVSDTIKENTTSSKTKDKSSDVKSAAKK